jgi:hypothetical protein
MRSTCDWSLLEIASTSCFRTPSCDVNWELKSPQVAEDSLEPRDLENLNFAFQTVLLYSSVSKQKNFRLTIAIWDFHE